MFGKAEISLAPYYQSVKTEFDDSLNIKIPMNPYKPWVWLDCLCWTVHYWNLVNVINIYGEPLTFEQIKQMRREIDGDFEYSIGFKVFMFTPIPGIDVLAGLATYAVEYGWNLRQEIYLVMLITP